MVSGRKEGWEMLLELTFRTGLRPEGSDEIQLYTDFEHLSSSFFLPDIYSFKKYSPKFSTYKTFSSRDMSKEKMLPLVYVSSFPPPSFPFKKSLQKHYKSSAIIIKINICQS